MEKVEKIVLMVFMILGAIWAAVQNVSVGRIIPVTAGELVAGIIGGVIGGLVLGAIFIGIARIVRKRWGSKKSE